MNWWNKVNPFAVLLFIVIAGPIGLFDLMFTEILDVTFFTTIIGSVVGVLLFIYGIAVLIEEKSVKGLIWLLLGIGVVVLTIEIGIKVGGWPTLKEIIDYNMNKGK